MSALFLQNLSQKGWAIGMVELQISAHWRTKAKKRWSRSCNMGTCKGGLPFCTTYTRPAIGGSCPRPENQMTHDRCSRVKTWSFPDRGVQNGSDQLRDGGSHVTPLVWRGRRNIMNCVGDRIAVCVLEGGHVRNHRNPQNKLVVQNDYVALSLFLM